mgnify:CR=1 FL=1
MNYTKGQLNRLARQLLRDAKKTYGKQVELASKGWTIQVNEAGKTSLFIWIFPVNGKLESFGMSL